ncbi:MAG: hypothetical protein HOO99_18670, partial [Hyphomicrobiaceae bacterium]|nr:hypothetical protein [Hyphomicrobiaceae bacterium]
MAGIGFRLRALAGQETISSIVAAAGHAAVIAAGPWLFTIFALAAITLTTDQITGTSVLSNFRGIIIYAFATSLVLAAPVTIVATRLVGDALWLKKPADVPRLLLGAYGAVLPLVALGVVLEIWWFRLGFATALALMAASLLVALIWVALAFCGAVRDYRGVTLSFLVGLALAMLMTIGAALVGFASVGLAWGFISGLTVTFIGLTSRIQATFPHAVTDPIAGMRDVISGVSHYQRLVV